MKFIHTADLHIDSPLRGLDLHDGAPVDRIRHATRRSFENIITLAINEQVDFMIIAGDLFDGKWQDIKTGLWTAHQFRRLARENIPVYLLRGNHDSASQVQSSITWPDNVHEFSVDQPQTFVIERFGVALHGQGFPKRDIPEDLAATYPKAIDGLFNIGVLHTSLTGDPQHDPYAPTNEDVLVARGYDYWALGHIHARRVVRQQPFIAFPGNIQGRHIREPGAKGCLLATVEAGQLAAVEFRPTDTLRWHQADIQLAESDNIDDLYDAVRNTLRQCHAGSEDRFSAVRLVVRGRCAAHRSLVSIAAREEVIGQIRNLASEITDELWTEKVLLETSAAVDLDELRRGNDLMGDLLKTIEQLATHDGHLRELAGQLDPLAQKAALELEQAGVKLDDPEQLRHWLREAESLLVSLLWEAEA